MNPKKKMIAMDEELQDLFNSVDIPLPQYLFCRKCNKVLKFTEDFESKFLGKDKFHDNYQLICKICNHKIFEFSKVRVDDLPK